MAFYEHNVHRPRIQDQRNQGRCLNRRIQINIHRVENDFPSKLAFLKSILPREFQDLEKTLVFVQNEPRSIFLASKFVMRYRAGVSLLFEQSTTAKIKETYRNMRNGDIKLLVCRDISCRGLNADDLAQVVHFDNPIATSRQEMKKFIERCNLTGRSQGEDVPRGDVHVFINPDVQNDRAFLVKLLNLVAEQENGTRFEPWAIELANAEIRRRQELREQRVVQPRNEVDPIVAGILPAFRRLAP